MVRNLVNAWNNFPRQFWLLVMGSLLSSIGGSMVWPFLVIYLRTRLGVSLTTITALLTLNSIMGLAASFIAGPATDKFGRKPSMVLSLFFGIFYFTMMSQASTLMAFAVLMALWGAFNPLYSVGSNAMIADLIEADKRIDAYAVLRVVHNAGVAIGPLIGGMLIAISYNVTFYTAAVTFGLFGLLTLLFIKETLPQKTSSSMTPITSGGLLPVLRDRLFMSFMAGMVVNTMASSVMFILLPVYTYEQFGLPESQYGWIVTTNALMCVFVQYGVTRITKKRPDLAVLAIGGLFYAMGVGSVAIGRGFWAFVISMVVVTIGELIVSPTATSLTARLAPADMRGRYMSLFTLSWPLAAGIGPVIAGLLNDNIAPVAIWYGGLVFGLASASIFGILFLVSVRSKSPHGSY